MARTKQEAVALFIDSDADAETTEEAVGSILEQYGNAKLIVPLSAEVIETMNARIDDEEPDPVLYTLVKLTETEDSPVELVVPNAAARSEVGEWKFLYEDEEYPLSEWENVSVTLGKNVFDKTLTSLDGEGVAVLFGVDADVLGDSKVPTILDGLDGLAELEFEDSEEEENEEDEEENGGDEDADDGLGEDDLDALVEAVTESIVTEIGKRLDAIEKAIKDGGSAPAKRGPGRPRGSKNAAPKKAAPAKRSAPRKTTGTARKAAAAKTTRRKTTSRR